MANFLRIVCDRHTPARLIADVTPPGAGNPSVMVRTPASNPARSSMALTDEDWDGNFTYEFVCRKCESRRITVRVRDDRLSAIARDFMTRGQETLSLAELNAIVHSGK